MLEHDISSLASAGRTLIQRFVERYGFLEEMCYHSSPAGLGRARPKRRSPRHGPVSTQLLLRKVDLDRRLAELFKEYLDDL